MPMKRSGRSVVEASRVIEIEEVFEAINASGFKIAQRSWKILRLTSSFSTALSTTRSQSARSSSSSVSVIRPIALALASSLMTFLATCRDRWPLMVAIPDFSRSAETSLSTTSKPASAATCAMPLPIWPAPITPSFLITAIFSSTGTAAHITPAPNKLHRPDFAHLAGALNSFSELAELRGQFGNGLVEIRDQAVVGHLEDRRVLVFVDRHDDLGVLHAGEMLDGAGDADGNVELGRHHLAGLADLPVVGRIAGVDCGARGADARTELVGKRLAILGEIFPALPGAAAGDDDLRRGQLGTVALGDFLAEEA